MQKNNTKVGLWVMVRDSKKSYDKTVAALHPVSLATRLTGSMTTLSKKIVLTGVSQGLGLAMLRRFIAEGCDVAGCARNSKAILTLREEFPRPSRFDVVNVSDAAAVNTWAADVLDRFGVPDLLINNAALMNRPAPLWEVPEEEFSSLIDVNIKGTYNVVRAFVPSMIERGVGVIVNFSSGWGRSTSPDVAPYCASKWAIEGLTKSLASELPRGMAAVPMSPGIINTEMLQRCFGDSADSYPLPDAWANDAVPYLLSLGPKDNGQSKEVRSL
jgi:NAD(P)-dependent dehydrogenase (short-subunit alcohol dehydrogenase family)